MSRLMRFAVAGLVAGVPVAWSEAAEAPPPRRPQACVGAVVGSIPERAETTRRGRRRNEFSLREVQDLSFVALLAGRPAADTTLEVQIFTPHGHLYQKREVPVAEAEGSERVRRLRGYRFPLKVAKPRPPGEGELASLERRDRSRRALQAVTLPPFPVAGTLIETHSLYGDWRFEARIQGGEGTCRTRFRLTD